MLVLRLKFRTIRKRIARTPLRRPLVAYRNARVQANDVVLASYPRSGSTWMRFMLFEALTGRISGFDVVNAAIPDVGRTPGWPLLSGGARLLKTHERYSPPYRKAIYLVRDLRDVGVSEYHYQQKVGAVSATQREFLRDFLAGRVNAYGSWAEHVRSWLQSPLAGHHLLLLRYEDLVSDTAGGLREALGFLGVRVHRARVNDAAERHSLENMQHKEDHAKGTAFRKTSGHVRFVRRGTTGTWRGEWHADELLRLTDEAGGALQLLGYPTH